MGSFPDRLVTVIYWLCVSDCDVRDMNDKHVPLSRMSVDEPLAATNSLLADRMNRREPRWIGIIATTALSALYPVTAVRAGAEAGTRTGAGSTARDPNGPTDGCKKGSEDQGFWSRLKDSYTSHLEWNGGEPTAPPAMMVGGTEPRWRGYLSGVLIAAGCTALAAIMSIWFAPTNLAMVYLIGVVLAATRLGRNAAVATSVVGTLAFDFFFIPPIYSFAVSDTQYLITAIVLLTVGLVISSLASGLRLQAHTATLRERRTAALYAMARELATASSLDDIATSSLSHLAKIFDASGLILLKRPDGTMRSLRAAGTAALLESTDTAIADWVFTQQTIAGVGTETLPAADAIYLPLNGTLGKVGVLVVHRNNRRPP
jgi:Domain of unknown function (DUF4118)